MLNQEERRRFNEIARHLSADPAFVRQVRAPDAGRPKGWAWMLCALMAVTAANLAIVVGWWGALPALGLLLVAVTVVLLRRRRRSTF